MGTSPAIAVSKIPEATPDIPPATLSGTKKPKKNLNGTSRGTVSSGQSNQGPGRPEVSKAGPKSDFGAVYQGALKKTLAETDGPGQGGRLLKKKTDKNVPDPANMKNRKAVRKKGRFMASSLALSGAMGPDRSLSPEVAPPGLKKHSSSLEPVLWGPVNLRKGVPPSGVAGIPVPGQDQKKGSPAPLPPVASATDSLPRPSRDSSGVIPNAVGPSGPELPSLEKKFENPGSGTGGDREKGEGSGLVTTLPVTGKGAGTSNFSGFQLPGGSRPEERSDLSRPARDSFEGGAQTVQRPDSDSAVSGAPPSPGAMGAAGGSLASAPSVLPKDSNSPVLPPELPGRVSDLARGGGGQVSLEVRPPHLGPVAVRVRIDPHTRLVSVELSSHDSRIRHLLASKEGSIKESLSQSGFVLDRFQVGASAPAGTQVLQDPGNMNASGTGEDLRRDSSGRDGSGGSDTGIPDPFSTGTSGSDAGSFTRQGTGAMGQDAGSGSSRRALGDSIEEVGGSGNVVTTHPVMSGGMPEPGYHRIA